MPGRIVGSADPRGKEEATMDAGGAPGGRLVGGNDAITTRTGAASSAPGGPCRWYRRTSTLAGKL